MLNNIDKSILDVESVVKSSGGKPDFAKQLLEQFFAELPETRDSIEKAFKAQDWELLEQHIHKLHGALAYCGMPRLKEATKNLEIALRKNMGSYDKVYQQFVVEADMLMKEFQEKNLDDILGTDLASKTAAEEGLAAQIMLVEDDTLNQMIIKELLEMLGCTVITVSNGKEALKMLQTLSPGSVGTVLMDIGLPDMNGIEVTKSLRQSDAPLKNVPIIALTGHVSSQYKDDCIAAGMNDFLNKPTTRDELERVLTKFAKRS